MREPLCSNNASKPFYTAYHRLFSQWMCVHLKFQEQSILPSPLLRYRFWSILPSCATPRQANYFTCFGNNIWHNLSHFTQLLWSAGKYGANTQLARSCEQACTSSHIAQGIHKFIHQPMHPAVWGTKKGKKIWLSAVPGPAFPSIARESTDPPQFSLEKLSPESSSPGAEICAHKQSTHFKN